MKAKILISLALIMILVTVVNNQDYKSTEDRLYINGQIITLENAEKQSQAMLVVDGKIAKVGTTVDLLKIKSANVKIVDLKNQIVLPGFIDSHSHVALSSFFTDMVDLSGFTHQSNKEVWDYLSSIIKKTQPGELIIAKGIDSILVKDLILPTRTFLDKISPNNPIFLISQSMHTYWANTQLFEAAGITRDTKNPSQSSYYGRDKDGNLSGIIIEQEAFVPFLDFLKSAKFTPEALVKATRKTFKSYAKNGNTTVISAGLSIDDKKPLRLYEHISLERTSTLNNILTLAGLLPKREPFPRHFIYIRHDRLFLLPEKKIENDFYNILGVKHWYDGSPYTGSMYLNKPYKNSDLSQEDLQLSKVHRGEALISPKDLNAFIKTFHDKGWQIAIHAQGDIANEEVVAAFEHSGLDLSQSRHRLEHCVLLTASTMEKIKTLNLFPNFHINHLLYYGDALKNDLIGEQRAEQMLALGAAQKANIKFAMHADQPMFESKPFRLIQTAVERKTTAGVLIGEEHKISVLEAVKAMTIDAAYSIMMEDKLGSLAAGKYADFIIIDKNPFEIPNHEIENIKILKTFVNGNEVAF